MPKLRFFAYAGETPNGSTLGELTHAFDKAVTVEHNGLGSALFSINRHDTQAAWCEPGNYVKVQLDDGDPIFGFWLESGSDVVISTDEEGGEKIQRAGRGSLAFIDRAIIWNVGTASGLSGAPQNDGNWHWVDQTLGAPLADMLADAVSRAVQIFDTDLLLYFSAAHDSGFVSWPTVAGDFKFPIGLDLLSLIQQLQAAGIWIKMTPALGLYAYASDPGTDRSGTVTFSWGANIRESADRQVQSTPVKSHVLVGGDVANQALTFMDVADSGLEANTKIGRREGFTTYEATNSTTVLDSVGAALLARLKKLDDGPVTLGVTRPGYLGDTGPGPHYTPFTDYFQGDFVTVDVPEVFDSVSKQISSITLTEDAAGDYVAAISFEGSPFDPTTPGTDSPVPQPGTGGAGPVGGAPVLKPPAVTPPVPPHQTACSYVAGGGTTDSSLDLFGGYIAPGGAYSAPSTPPPVTAGITGGGTLYGTPDNGSNWGIAAAVLAGPFTVEARWTFDIASFNAGSVCHITIRTYGFSPTPGASYLQLEASNDGASWTTILSYDDFATLGAYDADIPSLAIFRYWSIHYYFDQTGSGLTYYIGMDLTALLLWSGTVEGRIGDVTLDDTVIGIRQIAVSATAPTNGQALVYSASALAYVPATVGGAGNLDGGTASSTYGGTTAIDGGTA